MKQKTLALGLIPAWLAWAVCATAQARAATYVVDRAAPGAADTNAGTEEKPFKTVRHAADVVNPGDIVLVMAGQYDERVNVRTSGAEGQPITLRAVPRRAVVVGGFDLQASFIRVEGFEITAAKPALAVQLGGSHCEVLDNYVHDMMAGVAGTVGRPSPDGKTRDYSAVAHNRIAYNKVYHSQYGFMLGGEDWLVENNEVNRLFMYTPGNKYDDCDYSRFFGKGCVERYNYFHGSTSAEIRVAHVDGLQTFTVNGEIAHDLVFENNTCFDFHQMCMVESAPHLGSVRGWTFRGNIVSANSPTMSGGWGPDIIQTPDVTIAHNTISTVRWAAIGLRGKESTNGQIRNNILSDAQRAVVHGDKDFSAANPLIEYNLTFKTWPVPGEKNINGKDPLFVDAAARNFRVRPGSPAIGAGQGGVTIGAMEYPNVYYVDPRHPAAADEPAWGYPAVPLASLAKACAVAKPGETIVLRGGVYRETLRPGNDGVTIRAMQGETVTISGADVIEGWKREADGSWTAPLRFEPKKVLRDGQPWDESSYEAAAKRIVVKSGDPRLHVFETVVRQQGIDLGGRKDVKLEGIKVTNTLAKISESQAVNTWSRFGNGPAGERTGSVLLYARDASRLLLLGGEHKASAAVQAVDLASRQWTEFATNTPQRPIHPYYQVAYHPKRRTVYCLSNGSILYAFNTEEKSWQAQNDTWILDLDKKSWRRAHPELAPSPRAGHAMVYLPKSGRVAVYEGYAASSDPSYGASPAATLNPRELWLHDAQGDRWDLAGAWPAKGGEPAPPNVGGFCGYSASWFAVPPLAADSEDQLFLFTPSRKQESAAVWTLRVDPGTTDVIRRDKLGQPPNQRRVREEYFRADYCEVAEGPKRLDLATIPANQWVPFPRPARVPASGCRQRDWGTVVWDSDRDQVLLWGGGHCVRSSSVVLHFSPAANRFAEGYDADEPYCYNGFCGPGSSLLNRQWIDCHAYNLYAYDPKCRLLVTARGFLYDPARMDWVRAEPFRPPFAYSWGSVVIETSAHGAVAWAQKTNSDEFNLWLFAREQGWTDLKPQGKLHACYCDSDGMVYDSKRDRMLLGWGGGYGKRGDGTITAFDFKTKAVEKITPENLELGRTSGTREMVYVPEADLVLFGSEGYGVGDPKTGKRLTRVYDGAKNRYVLLDGGAVAYGHSAGWMYDSQRRCAYVVTYRGECWAMRIDPATLSLLERTPEPDPTPRSTP